MKKYILALILISTFVAPAIAAKPEFSGKGKPTVEQKQRKDKKKKPSKSSGIDKQKSKKLEQERKELGKGSAKGQESREAHSKKWWKFWGE